MGGEVQSSISTLVTFQRQREGLKVVEEYCQDLEVAEYRGEVEGGVSRACDGEEVGSARRNGGVGSTTPNGRSITGTLLAMDVYEVVYQERERLYLSMGD